MFICIVHLSGKLRNCRGKNQSKAGSLWGKWAISINMNESQKHWAKTKKQVTQEYIKCDSIYMLKNMWINNMLGIHIGKTKKK